MKTTFVVRLDQAQKNRVRDLIGEHMDVLFDRLRQAGSENNTGRSDGLREALKFWTRVDIALRDAPGAPYFTEDRIATLAAEIAAKGLDPLNDEQLALLRSNDPDRFTDADGMLADLRDRCGLAVPELENSNFNA